LRWYIKHFSDEKETVMNKTELADHLLERIRQEESKARNAQLSEKAFIAFHSGMAAMATTVEAMVRNLENCKE
jgi:hypothetical protein